MHCDSQRLRTAENDYRENNVLSSRKHVPVHILSAAGQQTEKNAVP